MKRTLESLEGRQLEGMRALVRTDFNVPLTDSAITDASRITASLPTIRWLREQGCRVVLMSHLGRPKGKVTPEFSLRPIASELELQLGIPVSFLERPGDPETVRATKTMKRGEVALLENTRFVDGEESNAKETAALFASLGDFYVNDAFGTAHRAHASTEGVAHLLKPAVAGFLLLRELQYLGTALEEPERPFVAVLGGAKISGKIDVIEALLPKVDRILIGGAMACTFFRALGLEVGESLVEEDRIDMAVDLMERAGEKIVLPVGGVVGWSGERGGGSGGPGEKKVQREGKGGGDEPVEVPRYEIPRDSAILDIDHLTREKFGAIIEHAKTVLWNGPMGVFERPPYDAGTIAIAEAVARATALGATTIVAGGDSAAAIAHAGLTDEVSHVSTGGGAALEFLKKGDLPAVAALDDV